MSIDTGLTFSGLVRSMKCSFTGFRVMIATQYNAWIHAAATIVVVLVSFWLRLTKAEWCLIISIISVWTAEGLNTAFEFLTDVATPVFHPLAEKAKDVA